MLSDLKFAIRTLSKSPAFTITAVLTLALGIGANTAVFSVVNAVLLQALPYPDPDRLVNIEERRQSFGTMSVAYPNYLDWRATQRSFKEISIYRGDSFNLKGEGDPERVQAVYVSASYFRVLGVNISPGRGFTDNEDRDSGAHVAILTEQFWRRRFGADPGIIGRTVTLDEVNYEIIAVAPQNAIPSRGIGNPASIALFVPFGPVASQLPLTSRDSHPGLKVIGRLKDGTSIDQARAEFDIISRNLETRYPETNSQSRIWIAPLLDATVQKYRETLNVLFAVVGFVLLICCANVANLLLARAASREKEIAVRTALGAGRRRIMAQLLTESLLIALVGGVLGVIFAFWSLDAIISLAPQESVRFQNIRINAPVLGFTAIMTVVTGLLFGLFPAWKISRADLGSSLKNTGAHGGTTSHDRQRAQGLLVLAQVAIASIVLIGSALLVDGFRTLQTANLGFDPQRLLMADMALPESRYGTEHSPEPKQDELAGFLDQVLAKAATIPGVRSAALTINAPFGGSDWEFFFGIVGRPDPKPGEELSSEEQFVSPSYFETMRIPILRGRGFNRQDRFGRERVTIVDEAFAKEFFPGQDPIGQQIHETGTDAHTWTIIGIVPVVEHREPGTGLRKIALSYRAIAQAPNNYVSVLLRGDSDPRALIHPLAEVVQSFDTGVPLYHVQSMEEAISLRLSTQRLAMTLVGLFSTIALVLAAVGLYGMLAYSVVRRTREIGIRIALGAIRAKIFRLILWNGMSVVGIGLAIGLILAGIVARFLTTSLYGLEPNNPGVVLVVVVTLIGTTFFACWWPARRAMKIDPIAALREE
jgi:putative ABC transport system permease protein